MSRISLVLLSVTRVCHLMMVCSVGVKLFMFLFLAVVRCRSQSKSRLAAAFVTLLVLASSFWLTGGPRLWCASLVFTLLYSATLHLAVRHILWTPTRFLEVSFSGPFRLLDLPVEIRIIIYEALLPDNPLGLEYCPQSAVNPINSAYGLWFERDGEARRQYHKLCQVCSAIRAEVRQSVRSGKALIFGCGEPTRSDSGIEECMAWIQNCTPENRRNIRKLIVMEPIRSDFSIDRILRLHHAGIANPHLNITLIPIARNGAWVCNLADWHCAHPTLPLPLSFNIRLCEDVFPKHVVFAKDDVRESIPFWKVPDGKLWDALLGVMIIIDCLAVLGAATRLSMRF